MPKPNDSEGTQGPDQGKPQGKPEDTQGENIKALQRKLTERDKELKTLQSQLTEKEKNTEDKAKHDGSEIEKLRQQIKEQKDMIQQDREDRKVEIIKSKFPKYSEKLVRLILRDTEGNLEETASVLSKQSETLGVKKVETPKFNPETAKQKIQEIKDDKTLAWDEQLYRIKQVKDNTQK